MTKSNTIIRSLAIFAIGGIVGAVTIHFYDHRKTSDNYAGSTCIQSHRLMHQIELMDQQAYPELRNDLQGYLDTDICILGLFATRHDEVGILAKAQLKRINDYRKLHPFQSDSPEFNQRVLSALSLGN